MKKKIAGYFTVETAMVMPIVLWAILFIIYVLFFQYNRCLAEQDVGILVLRGSVSQEKNNEERIKSLRRYAEQIYDDKYIAWDGSEIQLRIEKGVLHAKQSGEILFPFGKILPDCFVTWEGKASYANHILSPVSFVRNCRKLIGE